MAEHSLCSLCGVDSALRFALGLQRVCLVCVVYVFGIVHAMVMMSKNEDIEKGIFALIHIIII